MDQIEDSVEAQATLAVAQREAQVQNAAVYLLLALKGNETQRMEPGEAVVLAAYLEELAAAVRSGPGALCYRMQQVSLPAWYMEQVRAQVMGEDGASPHMLPQAPPEAMAA